ncbi:DUF3566 domain-containing protein [Streptomyces sp. NPDC096311]|uniref:DUF3566 domain-containing protein n=1 Tax=Streptomyces sp. NPDC096311 TaxID=3366083 RepID=UPI003826F198
MSAAQQPAQPRENDAQDRSQTDPAPVTAVADGPPLHRDEQPLPAAGRPCDPAAPVPRAACCGPGRQMARLRMTQADPWSVMATSFLVLVSLGACVVVTMAVIWSTLSAIDPQPWPSLRRGLTITTAVVVLEVILGTALATLSAYLYNMSSQYLGGVQLTLADDVTEPAQTGAAALLLDQLRARVRQRLRTRLGSTNATSGAEAADTVGPRGRAPGRLRVLSAVLLEAISSARRLWRNRNSRASGDLNKPAETDETS